MVTLEIQDRQELIAILQASSLMQDSDSRRQALQSAGLERLLPLISLDGAPFVASSRVVSFLAQYGRLTYENEALGLFLNAMKLWTGVQQQAVIDRLLIKYSMMDPIAPPKDVSDWKSTTTGATIVEKVFGQNTLHPIAFLARGVEVSRSVAYVSVSAGAERWSGTGFMIAPGLAMTNHHVISDSTQLPGVLLRFNYQENFAGEAQPTKEYRAKAGGLFAADPKLDFAILEVDGDPGNEWGWLPLHPGDIKTGDRINIIQHPEGRPKQISMQNNLVEYVGGDVLQYVTSTNPGSSGSPVFDDSWQVVGLHHAGGSIPEPTTGKYYNRNEGILIQKILGNVPAAVRQSIDQAAMI
jgi:V8-like Glu-specific endopeptidase